jgi:hypothetical protein
MRKSILALIVAVALWPLPTMADNSNPHPGWSIGEGNPHGGAPATIIGAGLPAFVVAGIGYILYRRKQKKD